MHRAVIPLGGACTQLFCPSTHGGHMWLLWLRAKVCVGHLDTEVASWVSYRRSTSESCKANVCLSTYGSRSPGHPTHKGLTVNGQAPWSSLCEELGL